MSQSILSCHDVSHRYDPTQVVLDGLSLELGAGQRMAIIGRSGSGKSTLLHLLCGLMCPSAGAIYLMGERFDTQSSHQRAAMRRMHCGFIYQFHHLLPEFNVIENVCMPLWIGRQYTGDIKQRALETLKACAIEELAHRPIETLSGGQKQRVAIARAMVHRPRCIFADEPTGNLDAEHSAQIAESLIALGQSHQTAMIVVTHDLVLARKIGCVHTLNQGRLVPIKEPETGALQQSPDHDTIVSI